MPLNFLSDHFIDLEASPQQGVGVIVEYFYAQRLHLLSYSAPVQVRQRTPISKAGCLFDRSLLCRSPTRVKPFIVLILSILFFGHSAGK